MKLRLARIQPGWLQSKLRSPLQGGRGGEGLHILSAVRACLQGGVPSLEQELAFCGAWTRGVSCKSVQVLPVETSQETVASPSCVRPQAEGMLPASQPDVVFPWPPLSWQVLVSLEPSVQH